MRILRLLLIPVAAVAGVSLVPSGAHAAKIPICIEKKSDVICGPVYDPYDCIRVDGQEYCRTIMLYLWGV